MRRLTILIIVGSAAALAACASGSGGGVFDRLAGANHIEGGPDTVTIHGMASAADAFPLAIGHCSHYSKSAQYGHRSGDDFVFNCVASH